MDVIANLKRRGLLLPEPPPPVGAYDPVVERAGVLYVSGQLPFENGRLALQGRLGWELTTHDGYRAAQVAALNALAQVERSVGFDRLLGLNRIEGYFVAADGWDEFPKALDGASDLFLSVLGDAGRHARAVFGVAQLPLGAPLELTCTFTLRPPE
jgi:enamine deaminase RidA (YjgF/YER057c/UK114 family)